MYLTSQQCFFIIQFPIIDFRYYNYDARILFTIKTMQWLMTVIWQYLPENISPFCSLFLLDYRFIYFAKKLLVKSCCCLAQVTTKCPGYHLEADPHESQKTKKTEWNAQQRTLIFLGSILSFLSIWAKNPGMQFRQLTKTFRFLAGLLSQVLQVVWMIFTRRLPVA